MFLDKLKEWPKNKTLIIVTIVTLIPFIILTAAFCINELELETLTGYGVLDFELAWTSDTINNIFTAWGSAVMQEQAFMTYIDYIYIPCYGLFGAECVLLISRKLEGDLLRFGLIMSLCTIIAGFFDAIENLNLLIMLENEATFSLWNPIFASLCATFKIGFIGAGLGFLSMGSLILLGRKYEVSNIYLILIGAGIIFLVFLAFWSLFITIIIGVIYFGMIFYVRWTDKLKSEELKVK